MNDIPEPPIPDEYLVCEKDRFYMRWWKRYNAWGYAAGFRWSYRITGWLYDKFDIPRRERK